MLEPKTLCLAVHFTILLKSIEHQRICRSNQEHHLSNKSQNQEKQFTINIKQLCSKWEQSSLLQPVFFGLWCYLHLPCSTAQYFVKTLVQCKCPDKTCPLPWPSSWRRSSPHYSGGDSPPRLQWRIGSTTSHGSEESEKKFKNEKW